MLFFIYQGFLNNILILILITLALIALIILIKAISAELKNQLFEQEILIFLSGFMFILLLSLLLGMIIGR